MPSPDELADALASRIEGATGSDYGRSIRTLARDAAKQALLDAADEALEFSPNGRYVAEWLRARGAQMSSPSK